MKTPTPEEADALAYEIGALFMNFSGFEHTLNQAVAATLGLNQTQSNALVRGMFPRAKIELLSTYAKKHWTKEAQEKLKLLTVDALALTDYRNDIAHGFIGHGTDGKFATITFRGAHRFQGNAQSLPSAEVGERVALAMHLSLNFQKLADVLTAKSEQQKAAQPQPRQPK
jgi:hypothetical protein